MVDVEHYPVTIILPIFAGPTVARFPEMVGRNTLPWARTIGWDVELLKTRYGVESFASNSIDGWSLTRMLAKIAYADAIARIGLNNFKPLVIDLILREDIDPSTLVGTFAKIENPVGDQFKYHFTLHEYTVEGVRYLVSKIRLFSNLGAPTYLVVVGLLDPRWSDPRDAR